MALRTTHRRLISAAVAVPLLIAIPLSGPVSYAQAHQVPQANLNPCPQEKGKVNITFWTWEGPAVGRTTHRQRVQCKPPGHPRHR